MVSKHFKTIFLILFAILYVSVAFVSTFHAISFFGLANSPWISTMLAITFEIGQAAVLFSILTGASGKNKIIPWVLMVVLTLVQVLGNVFSSYEYLITNSSEALRFFKEPIFVWTDLPDKECNVILTYIIGAILPIVSLLMTSMVTNYIGVESEKVEDIKPEIKQEVKQEDKPEVKQEVIQEVKPEIKPEVKQEIPDESKEFDNKEQYIEKTIEPEIKPEPIEEENLKDSHFINLRK